MTLCRDPCSLVQGQLVPLPPAATPSAGPPGVGLAATAIPAAPQATNALEVILHQATFDPTAAGEPQLCFQLALPNLAPQTGDLLITTFNPVCWPRGLLCPSPHNQWPPCPVPQRTCISGPASPCADCTLLTVLSARRHCLVRPVGPCDAGGARV